MNTQNIRMYNNNVCQKRVLFEKSCLSKHRISESIHFKKEFYYSISDSKKNDFINLSSRCLIEDVIKKAVINGGFRNIKFNSDEYFKACNDIKINCGEYLTCYVDNGNVDDCFREFLNIIINGLFNNK